jgi:ribosome-associated toxin RatA of RatAB toxin-antitoxin module
MKKIHIKNIKVLLYSAKQIWDIIIDFNNYSEWWPSAVKTRVLKISDEIKGSQIEVRPYGGMDFICEVVKVKANTELVMEYSGIYKSLGVWTISENDGHCSVTYEIDLEVNHPLIRILSYLLPVDKIHYKLMEKVFLDLEQILVTKFGNANLNEHP